MIVIERTFDRRECHVRKPYLLFETWEEPEFKERFAADALGNLNWPPMVDSDDHVRIYDPGDADRQRRGDVVRTERVATIPK